MVAISNDDNNSSNTENKKQRAKVPGLPPTAAQQQGDKIDILSC